MGAVITLPVSLILGFLSTNTPNILFKCKWIISYIYIEIYRILNRKRFDLYDYNRTDDPEKTNILIPRKEYTLESPFPESHLLKAKDEVFFYGVNSKGEKLIISISRRCNNRAEACIYLKLESGMKYQLVQKTGVEQASTNEHLFSCGGLQLHYSNPMRRWRLFYNGYLMETHEEDASKERLVYVKFAMIWRASSDIFDFSEDINSNTLAEAIASAEWKNVFPPVARFKEALDAYGQAGIIHGTVTIDDKLEHEIYLFGQRIRDLGSNLTGKDIEFHHLLGYTQKDGTYIHLGRFLIAKSSKNLSFGYVVQPDSSMKEITHFSGKTMDLSPSKETRTIRTEFLAERSYVFKASLGEHKKQNEATEGSVKGTGNWIDELCEIQFCLNEKAGKGIYIKRKSSGIMERKTSYLAELKCPSVIPRTVSFNDTICQISEVTGGKGSSLGKLSYFSKQLNTFIVPEGIVVTTSSYEEILTSTVFSKIKSLEDVLCLNEEADIKKECQRLQQEIIGANFPILVQSAILQSMKRTFGVEFSALKFAVRSSATGEDTEQLSAAGQMDTFLGVCGFDEILKAVQKCWASQFSFIAVEYKRRYGQCINSPMAVVIQKMVPCDVAGVLFTCDPLTGNPTKFVITANYGLGESVVSGSEEPDTIVLERGINDGLRVKNTIIGEKKNKIVLKEKEGTGVENIAENQKNICCLPEEMALRLGHLAVKVENFYRSAQDIEWGFYNKNLYIFQSRPVTSGSSETTFEIDHEEDGPLRVENDYFSTSNVGEVLPGAISPLGFDVAFRMFFLVLLTTSKDTAFQLPVKNKYYTFGWMRFYSNYLFNIADIFRDIQGDSYDHMTQALLISFFGRVPDNKEIFEVTKERYGEKSKGSSLKSMYKLLKVLVSSSPKLKKEIKAYEGYNIPVEKYSSSKELFYELLHRMIDCFNAMTTHLTCSEASSTWNMLIFSTLGKEHGAYDDIVYRDFANLLRTSSDVESADVPAAIQSLAFHVSRAVKPEEFRSQTPEEALQWLRSSDSVAGKKFRTFIEKHGHRCLKEFDIHSVTWGSDPKPLVKLLQNLAGNVSQDVTEKKSVSVSQAISELRVKMGLLSKLKLKFLLPICRTAVQNRERSKSLIVKCMDAYRRGFNQLAKLMISEGRLPEKDLLFFMTLEDIRNILETRSPKILSRARQRQRRYPVLNKYRFPEITRGMPRPINETEDPVSPASIDFVMKGIPVSQGVVKGYARVAVTLDEATFLQPGEILITVSTDIGWTPYFPTLAGVVTEIGGLISHGAVVSREYGIPCIAGVNSATRRFQTGDYILLDGNKGVLQKLEPPSS